MLRAYLVIVLVIGISASMLSSRGPSPKTAAPQKMHVVDATSAPVEASADSQMGANLDGAIELKREQNGHFYADVEINGTPIRMLIDTGATGIALSRDDARRAGIATSIGMPNVVGQGA